MFTFGKRSLNSLKSWLSVMTTEEKTPDGSWRKLMSISLYEMNITNSAVTGGSVVNGLVSGRKQSYTQVNMRGNTYNYYFGILKY